MIPKVTEKHFKCLEQMKDEENYFIECVSVINADSGSLYVGVAAWFP